MKSDEERKVLIDNIGEEDFDEKGILKIIKSVRKNEEKGKGK